MKTVYRKGFFFEWEYLKEKSKMYKKVLKKDDYAKHWGCNKCTVVTKKKWAFCFIPNFKEKYFYYIDKEKFRIYSGWGKVL